MMTADSLHLTSCHVCKDLPAGVAWSDDRTGQGENSPQRRWSGATTRRMLTLQKMLVLRSALGILLHPLEEEEGAGPPNEASEESEDDVVARC